MDIQQIVSELEAKFGKKVDVNQVSQMLKGVDLSKVSIPDIAAKLNLSGINIKDLDGDGKEEGIVEEIKGKASQIFGGMFKK